MAWLKLYNFLIKHFVVVIYLHPNTESLSIPPTPLLVFFTMHAHTRTYTKNAYVMLSMV